MYSMFGGNAYWVAMITFFLHFFSFCNTTFFHSSYVFKLPQQSSAIYGAPPFTGNPKSYLVSKKLAYSTVTITITENNLTNYIQLTHKKH